MKTLLASLATFVALSASVQAAEVSDVRVRALDNFGGDVSSVASRCQTRKGATYDPIVVSRDVAALNESREFEDIKADAKRTPAGIEVTFLVKRKLRYRAPLQVEGAERFSVAKITDLMGLKDGYPYGEGEIAEAVQNVRNEYWAKHYPDVEVSSSVTRTTGNDCTVKLTISEGGRLKIRNYVFMGAEGVDEAELHEAIGDYPWWNPTGWFSDAPVSAKQLAECVAKVETVFRNHGYLDVKVSQPRRRPVEGEPEKCDILFAVASSTKYVVGKTSIRGLTRYSEADVRAKSALPEEGSVAGQNLLEEAARRIQIAVGSGDSGLADTVVRANPMPRADKADVVDIVFDVKEGVPVVLNDVVIEGNDYTMDKVIRREIELGPGDRMLQDRAERSQRKLENLGYFSRVNYRLAPTARGKDAEGREYRDLVYEVEEKSTGSFMVGVGASSVDSVYVSAEVSQSNFDLFAPQKFFRGGGQKARAYVAWGPRYQMVEASLTEPHLFERFLELTVEAHRRLRWYDEYDLIRSGASVTLSYPMKVWNPARLWRESAAPYVPFGRFGARYTAEYVEFDDVENGDYMLGNKSVSFKDEERRYGDKWESIVRFYWMRDTRDNFRMPTTGSRTQLFFDISAGGEVEFWRAGFSHRSYFTTWERFGHVLMAGVRAETIDAISDDVPIYERMFLGGPRTIRGVRYRHVSPFVTKTYSGDGSPWGGQTLFCMNFEYTIPIVRMLRLAVFTDLGSVGEDCFDFDFAGNFAWTVGVGLRLDIPMFPIRLDFATPLKKPDEADDEVFSFMVGYDF